MRFCILCLGTYGDVAPYVALGAKLKANGHEITIAAHEKARSLCQRFLLNFSPIGGDMSVEATPEESRMLFEAKGIWKIISFFKLTMLMKRVLGVQLRDCLAVAKGADCLIYHPATFAGPHLAERFQIPAIRMNLQPEHPTKEHPSCLVPMPKWLGWLGKWLGHFSSQQFLWQVFRGEINRWRWEALGLANSPFWKPTNYSRIYNLVAFSSVLIPRPTDWHPSVKMSGFCRLKEADTWTPPPELTRFLQEGEAPLYLGFGSLSDTFDSPIIRAMIEVLQEKKVRAIIPKNLPGLETISLPSHILPIGYTPHDFLFPRMSALIHHGGVGTLAAGLYAGKKTLVIPCIVDQFFWGDKVAEWGVGPAPIPRVQFTKEAFARRVDELLAIDGTKTQILQQALNQEDGVESASRWILQITGSRSPLKNAVIL